MTAIVLENGMVINTNEDAISVVELFRQARLSKQMYVQVDVKGDKNKKYYTFINPAQVKVISDIPEDAEKVNQTEDDTTE